VTLVCQAPRPSGRCHLAEAFFGRHRSRVSELPIGVFRGCPSWARCFSPAPSQTGVELKWGASRSALCSLRRPGHCRRAPLPPLREPPSVERNRPRPPWRAGDQAPDQPTPVGSTAHGTPRWANRAVDGRVQSCRGWAVPKQTEAESSALCHVVTPGCPPPSHRSTGCPPLRLVRGHAWLVDTVRFAPARRRHHLSGPCYPIARGGVFAKKRTVPPALGSTRFRV